MLSILCSMLISSFNPFLLAIHEINLALSLYRVYSRWVYCSQQPPLFSLFVHPPPMLAFRCQMSPKRRSHPFAIYWCCLSTCALGMRVGFRVTPPDFYCFYKSACNPRCDASCLCWCMCCCNSPGIQEQSCFFIF